MLTPEQIDEVLNFCFGEVRSTGLTRTDTYDGSYDCFKYHGDAIKTALKMAKGSVWKEMDFLRPLNWEDSDKGDHAIAYTPFGYYNVYFASDGKPVLHYLFQEYFDEGSIDCENLEDGKQKAWDDWVSRSLSILQIPTPPKESE